MSKKSNETEQPQDTGVFRFEVLTLDEYIRRVEARERIAARKAVKQSSRSK